ncbi:MAG: FkbM family methyltransferase, partial [Actinomycetota bacterium]|nr:FkbM family methyltransferase [Actinomycetota bacterium]
MSAVPPLADALRDRLVVVNLGAGGDPEAELPEDVRRAMTLVQIDAANEAVDEAAVHRRVPLRRVIADRHGTRTFQENAYPWCSSLLPPRDDLVRRYGLEAYFEPVARTEVECFTLAEALEEVSIERVDFLKTDVEGLDAAILRASAGLLEDVLVLRSELRFEPFYEGEPPFHEAAAFLAERGFDLVGLDPEAWKPATRRAARHRDGRTVWADCVFLRRPELLPPSPPELPGLTEAKQVLLTAMAGLRSWSEHLLETYGERIPEAWHPDLWRATA